MLKFYLIHVLREYLRNKMRQRTKCDTRNLSQDRKVKQIPRVMGNGEIAIAIR